MEGVGTFRGQGKTIKPWSWNPWPSRRPSSSALELVLGKVRGKKEFSIYASVLPCLTHTPTHSSFLALYHFSIAFFTPHQPSEYQAINYTEKIALDLNFRNKFENVARIQRRRYWLQRPSIAASNAGKSPTSYRGIPPEWRHEATRYIKNKLCSPRTGRHGVQIYGLPPEHGVCGW